MDNILEKTKVLNCTMPKEHVVIEITEPIIEGIPPFPLDIFPQSIRDIINEANLNLNFPVDYFAASILYAFSVAIGNIYRIEVKRRVWYETVLLWIAIIGDVSVNKTHPLKFALKPIFEKDRESNKEFKEKENLYDEYYSLSQKERKESVKPEKPVRYQTLVSDFTQEVIAGILEVNPKGIGVWADELLSWTKNFNKYRNGSDEQSWLSIWSYQPLIINRKTSGSYNVENPFVSVIGTTQSHNAKELIKDTKATNGFFERILPVFPDNIKKKPWSKGTMPEDYIERYKSYINYYLSKPYNPENKELTTIYFSDEAYSIIEEWQRKLTDETNKTCDVRKKAILGKQEIYISRFCLLIQLIDDVVNNKESAEISNITAHKAIKLSKYFEENSLKIIRLVNETTPVDLLPVQQRDWYNALPNEPFTTSIAVDTAFKFKIKERTCKNYLNNKLLFIRINHGQYEKIC